MLLGVKAGALVGKRQFLRRSCVREPLQPSMAFVRKSIGARKRAHRPVTLTWVQRSLTVRLQGAGGRGVAPSCRGAGSSKRAEVLVRSIVLPRRSPQEGGGAALDGNIAGMAASAAA